MKESPLTIPTISETARQKCKEYIDSCAMAVKLKDAMNAMNEENDGLGAVLWVLEKNGKFESAVNSDHDKALGGFCVGSCAAYMAFGFESPQGIVPTIPPPIVVHTMREYPPTRSGDDWHFAITPDSPLAGIIDDIEGIAPISEPRHNGLHSGAGLVNLMMRNYRSSLN